MKFIYNIYNIHVDPVKILSKNIAVNKTIAGRCVKEIEKTKTTQINPKSLGPLFSKVKSNEKIEKV